MQLEDRLYSSTEVAKILGVSRRTLYRYLESGTLGSMHLPSGRHRFTKDQVEAFLVKTYGATDSKDTKKSTSTSSSLKKVENNESIEKVKVKVEDEIERPSVFSKVNDTLDLKEQQPEETNVKPAQVEKETEEEIAEQDDQAQLDEEQEEVDEVEAEDEVEDEANEQVDEVVEDLKKTLSSLFEDDDNNENSKSQKEDKEDAEAEEKETKSKKDSFQFYSSSITDLKKLAKTVKVASENSNVQYAFTGQAGASLFGEVSPFGQLHLYIQKNDMLFFEKRFDLKETSEQDSNVALKVVDNLPEHNIVMGFKVVSLPVLKKDLIQLGDTKTAGNLEG